MNFKLNLSEWWSIGKGALLAGIGVAAVTFLDQIGNINLGSYGAVIGGLAAVVANYVRKSITVPSE